MSSLVYCCDCGSTFSEDSVIVIPNRVPYGNTYAVESYTEECPYCRSDNLEFDYKGENEYENEDEDDE